MRTQSRVGITAALLASLALALTARPAAAVNVTCGNGAGLAGQTVDIDLTTTDLAGLNVKAYQFALLYDPSQVTATTVLTAGTLTGTAGWTSINTNFTSGRVGFAAAGTNALPAGAGVLVRVRFVLNPALLNGGYSGLALGSFVMNEGVPAVAATSGSISISATPQLSVYPDNAEIIRGRTIGFNAYGSVTLPVTWNVTNPAVATINSSGALRALAVGTTRVFAVDAAARRDTSNGLVVVRGMGDSVGTATISVGQSLTLPVYVTHVDSLAIRSGQLRFAWNPTLLSCTAVGVGPGTLLNGYGTSNAAIDNTAGTASFAFAGTTDLSSVGTQVLLNLQFTASPGSGGGTGIALLGTLFNENLPAVRTDGFVTVNGPASLTLNPYQVSLLTGQTQAFTALGSPALPLTWSTLNPAVATISPGGVVTARAGGVTQVKVVDANGSTALSGSITVRDFALTIPQINAPPGATVHVPLQLDRLIGGLGVFSVQYSLTFDPTWVTALQASTSGLVGSWAAPTVNAQSGLLRLGAAGDHALPSTGDVLEWVDVTISPSAPGFVDVPLTLTNVMFNEGQPIPLVTSGMIHVRTFAGTPPGGAVAFALSPAQPNPARGVARIAYDIPEAGPGRDAVSVVVYGPDGRRVRTLVRGERSPGRYDVEWDARDERGRAAAVGVYFVRLEWRGRHLERKLALVR